MKRDREVLVSAMRLLYEVIYHIMRIFRLPNAWVFGDKQALLDELLEAGRIAPGRAIDLGCGAGVEAVYLATKGFEVTGVDRSPTAIKLAQDRAQAAGVEARFLRDDLTDLRHVSGAFDLLLDFGALNDLNPEQRDKYVDNVLPLTQPGSRFTLMCFEKKLPREEIERRFGALFDIEKLSSREERLTSRRMATYWLTRKHPP